MVMPRPPDLERKQGLLEVIGWYPACKSLDQIQIMCLKRLSTLGTVLDVSTLVNPTVGLC